LMTEAHRVGDVVEFGRDPVELVTIDWAAR
jgi:hypothetical protein